jgi:hypothetical protein
VALYAVLRRRGAPGRPAPGRPAPGHRAPRWVAALAAAPVLLDAYQLQLEQTIMPDVLFETMIAAGLVLLLWRRRAASAPLLAAGALVLGVAATVREIGAVLIVPVVAFAAASAQAGAGAGAGADWRRRTGRAALAAGCFALPVLGYMTGTFVAGGHFGLGSNGPGPEYGRAAAAADCTTLVVPADERALCPAPAQTLALGGIDGLLHSPASPSHTVPVPPGVTRGQLLDRFSLAVIRQQPIRVAWSAVRDSVRLFAFTRDGNPQVTPITRWQFQTTLRGYQLGGGFTPGPLYAAFLALGVLGALSRRQGYAGACALVTLAAVVLLVSSDAFEFSWRYQLPAVVMLPLAGALGLTALTARFTAARTASGGTGRRTRPASAASGPRAPADR